MDALTQKNSQDVANEESTTGKEETESGAAEVVTTLVCSTKRKLQFEEEPERKKCIVTPKNKPAYEQLMMELEKVKIPLKDNMKTLDDQICAALYKHSKGMLSDKELEMIRLGVSGTYRNLQLQISNVSRECARLIKDLHQSWSKISSLKSEKEELKKTDEV